MLTKLFKKCFAHKAVEEELCLQSCSRSVMLTKLLRRSCPTKLLMRNQARLYNLRTKNSPMSNTWKLIRLQYCYDLTDENLTISSINIKLTWYSSRNPWLGHSCICRFHSCCRCCCWSWS